MTAAPSPLEAPIITMSQPDQGIAPQVTIQPQYNLVLLPPPVEETVQPNSFVESPQPLVRRTQEPTVTEQPLEPVQVREKGKTKTNLNIKLMSRFVVTNGRHA